MEKRIVVDIKGEVKNPGVYNAKMDDRIYDVIEYAGGLTKNANTESINLSKKIEDEMLIIIPNNEEKQNKKEEIEKLYCDNCGAEVEADEKECSNCGLIFENSTVYCDNCGTEVSIDATECPKCGLKFDEENEEDKVTVNKVSYCLLALFLGGVGGHKFYAGKMTQGIFYILFCWTFIPGLIAFIELIIALGLPQDKEGNIRI